MGDTSAIARGQGSPSPRGGWGSLVRGLTDEDVCVRLDMVDSVSGPVRVRVTVSHAKDRPDRREVHSGS